MSLFTILVLGVSLSMDAFAVSICKGLALRKIRFADMLKAGLWFGIFQGLMPAIGYFAGTLFAGMIQSLSSWIAFILLACIGGNMIREALSGEEENVNASMKPMEMFMLAVATSIDALAVGITFSVIPVEISAYLSRFWNTLLACGIIMLETGVFSMAGVKIGSIFGDKYMTKAQIAGGVILILIGLRILIQHFFTL